MRIRFEMGGVSLALEAFSQFADRSKTPLSSSSSSRPAMAVQS
jgi:hypothetical protein